MTLSTRLFAGALAAVLGLVWAGPASAQYVAPLPTNYAFMKALAQINGKPGFRTSMLQQSFIQAREELASRGVPPDLIEVIATEPRYVTIYDVNGTPRLFLLEGPINVVAMRRSVVHFGSNGSEVLVQLVPQPNVHFGANDNETAVAVGLPRSTVHFGSNR